MSAEQKTFSEWAIVEIFGHQKYAGLVSEQSIGGCSFVRLDVPETPRSKAFTKLFGQGAIYSMTPVAEDLARAAAARYDQAPVNVYDLPEKVRQAMRAIEQRPSAVEIDGEDDDRPF